MQDFVKFKMAAAAILDLCMCFRFCTHSLKFSPMHLHIKLHQFLVIFDGVIAFS